MSGIYGDLPETHIRIQYRGGWSTVEVPGALLAQIRELLATGNYGQDEADVVLRLVEEGCWRAVFKARELNERAREADA